MICLINSPCTCTLAQCGHLTLLTGTDHLIASEGWSEESQDTEDWKAMEDPRSFLSSMLTTTKRKTGLKKRGS